MWGVREEKSQMKSACLNDWGVVIPLTGKELQEKELVWVVEDTFYFMYTGLRFPRKIQASHKASKMQEIQIEVKVSKGN